MRKALIAVSLAVAVACGVYVLRAKENIAPAKAMQADIEPAVLAEALGLSIYAFDIPVPSEPCSLNVWVERWTRDGNAPTVYAIASLGGVSGGKLTVSFPNAASPIGHVNWSSSVHRTTQVDPLVTLTQLKSSVSSGYRLPDFDMKEITGTNTMQPREVVLDQDIPLMALVVNKSGLLTGGTENIEREHDVTYYLRARVSLGKTAHPAVWKDGKIQTN